MHSQLLPTIAAPPGNEDEDFSEKINLDLGIGSFACENGEGLKGNKKIKQEKREPFLTAAQFHEFYNQILVYNSIISGLNVPFHLLLPIWMSVCKSFGSDIYKKYPSFIGFCPKYSDRSSMTDSDPGRCRRTDGRKWRCSKSVVTNQKYCERHMHRGRHGSRKHVETIERDKKTSNDDSGIPVISLVTSDIDNGIDISNRSNGVTQIVKCRSDKSCDALWAGNEANANVNVGSATTNLAKNKYTRVVSPGFGLSPKSVLHSGAGKVNATETERQRCRRTDGKKWQCKQDALPDQKYCEAHMHRGAKKVISNAEYASDISAAQKARISSTTSSRSKGNGINLNTMPASPVRITTASKSTSSTSDATTITDENISFCLSRSLHYC